MSSWFDLKYPLSLSKRIEILNLMYEIIITPGMDDHVIDSAAAEGVFLLK